MRHLTLAIVIAALAVIAPSLVRAADGAGVYKAQCAKCHGEAGKADTPIAKALKVPLLAGDAKIAAAAPAEVVKMVKENPKHVSFITKLSAEDVDAAVAHVKELAGTKP